MAGKYPSKGSAKRVQLAKQGPPITTLVAEGSQMGCQLMASAFAQSSYPIRVTALAVDSLGVRNALKKAQPDIAVIGAGLKDGPTMGLKTARELRTSGAKTKTIILIDASTSAMVIEAFRAGAHGIIGRDEPFETLCKCVYVVHQGQVWINSRQLLGLINYLIQTAPSSMVSAGGSNALTKREEGVVRLIAEGMTNREISRQLNLSENTVRNYLFRIFNKVGISSRLELALYEYSRRQVHGISEGHPGPAVESRLMNLPRRA